jgi:hypothetical protein
VRASAAYQALPAAAQGAAERQVARVVSPLEQITPELTPAERDRLLAAFAEGLTPLVARGLLTGEQAAELEALARELE